MYCSVTTTAVLPHSSSTDTPPEEGRVCAMNILVNVMNVEIKLRYPGSVWIILD